ncbi:uncharacterized protein LOC114262654 [Camellia sinensis]|uniref:uncharacterized protein LOC114262654 n=1 Tax=Camellia sinensis TaxID=4442 RepID=UPI001035D9D0|nr:uncharacterized protein LOC114262654 [Camellia sinensis]
MMIRDRFAGAEGTARFRILLEGPVCRAWYLGERFLRQTLGLLEQIVSGPPPTHMRDIERCTAEEMADYTISWDAKGFKGEGDYAEYVRTYIMQPLNGGRRAERERPTAPVVGAGAGAGTSRTARVCGRSGARRGRGVSWPALPTMMTCRGRGGTTYQISIAPPPADHELVGFYGLPPVCTTAFCILHSHFISIRLIFRRILILLTLLQASYEYTRQSLELTASTVHSTIYGIYTLYLYTAFYTDTLLAVFTHCIHTLHSVAY